MKLLLSRAEQGLVAERNSLLGKEAETQGAIPILVKGVLRGYYLDAAGTEMTDCFGYEPGERWPRIVILWTNRLISI